MPAKSSPEDQFLALWNEMVPPGPGSEPIRQHRALPPRKWKLDFAWPSFLVAVEIQGLIGHHRTVKGMVDDLEKFRAHQVAGWIILPFTVVEITRSPNETIGCVLDAFDRQAMRLG